MIRTTLATFLMLNCWLLAQSAQPVWIASLDLTKATTGWGTAQANKGVAGGPIRIAGQQFERGVGTHAESKLRIDVGGNASRFSAQVGVDDSAERNGSVEFIVKGDDRVLWKSGIMTGGQPARSVDVDLKGVRVLTLLATTGEDGASHDHADWAEARLLVSDGAQPKALEPHESIALETKDFAIALQVGDDGRLYQRPIGKKEGKLERAQEAFPQWGDGYVWEPALQLVHADGNTSTSLVYENLSRNKDDAGREIVRIQMRDPAYPVSVALVFRLDKKRDVIEQWAELTHSENTAIKVERFASSSLLLSPEKLHLMHFHGDWADEMKPVVEPLTPGTKLLDSKLGVRAHRYRNPSFVLSLDGEPQENSGRVLAGSLAWSGSFLCAFDHSEGQVRAICGMNPFASAYLLEPGKTFTAPVMLWAWSDQGLGGMSRSLHAWARDFGFRDGNEPREVLLNNWEATGFDFDFERIAGLYEPARQLGVELFLLDDGWFGNKYPRVNDKAGLGDWEPNRKRLPNGVAPLARAAVDKGLRFGIWIEPEMVNPKSELFETHPDWVIRQPGRELELQRNQLTLDLTRPEVQAFEWQVIQDVFSVPGVSYVKWDCNRYLTQPGSPWLPPEKQTHLQIDYNFALYDLMERTMKTYPDIELMLCSGGGGRVDYGSLKYFHEFWPSDNTDPVRRVTMQWDYSYFFPGMTVAAHVTHWGKRPMHFACAVAMSARFGMDLDLARLSAEDKDLCANAIAAYKNIREITHLGQLYRLERPHNAERGALSYVANDQSRAVTFVFQLENGEARPVHPQGLNPSKKYVLRDLYPEKGRAGLPQEGKVLGGDQWAAQGFLPSCSKKLEACVVEFTAQD